MSDLLHFKSPKEALVWIGMGWDDASRIVELYRHF